LAIYPSCSFLSHLSFMFFSWPSVLHVLFLTICPSCSFVGHLSFMFFSWSSVLHVLFLAIYPSCSFLGHLSFMFFSWPSVLRSTASDYSVGSFKLFLRVCKHYHIYNKQ
jgi:predicted transcriptional regulator with HTH domain